MERINLNTGLGAGGEGAEMLDNSLALTNVLLVLSFKLSNEMVDHFVVKVFSIQLGISSS